MIDLSKLPHDSPLGRFLRLPLRLIPKRAVVRILRGPLFGKKWIAGSSIHGCWLGTYELEKQEQFSKSLSRGGHVGFYTLLAATRIGEEGKVVVFEPDPANVNFLKRHVSLNGFENVDVRPVAVSSSSGSFSFESGEHSSTGKISNTGDLQIKTVTLDELYKQGEISLPQCLKMDIEGAEYEALRGATEVLKVARPKIFLATHGEEVKTKCVSFLRELGYQVTPFSDDADEDEFYAVIS